MSTVIVVGVINIGSNCKVTVGLVPVVVFAVVIAVLAVAGVGGGGFGGITGVPPVEGGEGARPGGDLADFGLDFSEEVLDFGRKVLIMTRARRPPPCVGRRTMPVVLLHPHRMARLMLTHLVKIRRPQLQTSKKKKNWGGLVLFFLKQFFEFSIFFCLKTERTQHKKTLNSEYKNSF